MQWSSCATVCITAGALFVFLAADIRVSLTPEGSFHKVVLQRKQLVDRQPEEASTTPAEGQYRPDLSFVAAFTATPSSVQYGRTSRRDHEQWQIPYPSPRSAEKDGHSRNSKDPSISGEDTCTVPVVDWVKLEEHGCLVREDICVDQNRFITFDKRLQPGADFEDGLIFDHFSFHNIPGFPDNVRGAKTRFFTVLQRGNSTADPPDIHSPNFQACQVPLIWWPWWPFNPADVYLNSVLPLERMLREGVIDNQVQLVPVLDGLQPPRFYDWWFAPLSQQPVMPLGELSARTRAGNRCFKRMMFCNLPGLWKQPFDQNWTAGLQPSLVGQKIVEHYLPERSQLVRKAIASTTSGTNPLKVAFIERRKSRHILNLKDLITECNELTVGEAFDLRAVQCTAVSFDDVGNFTALLAELQTIDILVGVHGAGLVNTYFLRPGSAFVEIFPCRFAHPSLLFWPSQYFWHPHRQEQRILPFQIHMKDETRCKPSQLEQHPAAVNYREGPSFVQATLARDQDVAPNFKAISEVVSRYARFASSARSVASMLDVNTAGHFIVES